MVANTFYVAGEFSLTAYEALLASGKQLTLLMGRSVLLSVSVTFVAMVVGVPLGVLLGRTDLPLRGAFTMLLTLPLLIPPYVIAVAWFAVLGSSWVDRAFLVARGFRIPVLDVFRLVRLHRSAIHRVHAGRHAADHRISGDGESSVGTSGSIDEPLAPRAMAHHSAIDGSCDSICGCVGLSSHAWRSRRSNLSALPGVPGEILTQFAAFYDFSAATVAAIPLLAITTVILALEIRFLHTSCLGAQRGNVWRAERADRARTLALSAVWTRFALELWSRWRCPLQCSSSSPHR